MHSRGMDIVIPVYNEQDSLAGLVGEIFDVSAANGYAVRVVLVDDGSRDSSWERIVELAGRDPRVGGLRFRRNSGKAAALMAGFAVADADLVFMMDADGQDPPGEIPRFLQKIDEGFDVVSGWKQRRHDPWHKVYPSRVFNAMIGALTGVRLHDHVCGFKCFRREVLREVRIRGEFHRFLGVLAAAKGFRVTEIPTLHRPRTTGVSKYGLSRFVKGFLDLLTVWLLTRYRWRPIHVFGVAGLLAGTVGLLAWVPRLRGLLWPLPAVLAGLVILAVGVLAEWMVATGPTDELYTVTERVGWCRRAVRAEGSASAAQEPGTVNRDV